MERENARIASRRCVVAASASPAEIAAAACASWTSPLTV
jgi:hypothetical protein